MGWSDAANHHWRRFRRLGRGERRLAFRAALVLGFATFGPGVLGFNRCRSILAGVAAVLRRLPRAPLPPGRDGLAPSSTDAVAARTAAIVGAVVRSGPFRPNCLQRSLALWCLLKGQGIEGDLRVGVQKVAGQFEAHAWVEYLGRVLNDQVDVHQRFVAFDRGLIPGRAVPS